MSMAIVYTKARQILDSRGNPTVEVDIELEDGTLAALRFRAEPAPEPTKPANCATATRASTSARGSSRPSITSTKSWPTSWKGWTRSIRLGSTRR